MIVQGEGGRRLGRYHLAESLGAGPTGEVFRAKVYGVAGFERQFAVKRFHPELVSDPDRAGLLAQSARQHGALQHPRIARLHEFGVAGNETFAATELVRGLDLHRLLARSGSRTGLPPGAAAGLVAAAARAVGFAHSRGLAHLGIAPTNLLCTVDGDVKITDFGHLAQRLSARPAEDPALARRVAYLAPEQLRGEPGTTATDVFQLGLLACEVLTGQSAIGSADPRELERRARAGEPSVMALDLPRPLAQVLRRALALAPSDRFPEAAALADALDAAARSSPLPGDRRDLAAVVRVAIDEQIAREDDRPAGPGSIAPPAAVVPSPGAASSAKVGRVTLTGSHAPRAPASKRAVEPRAPVVPVRQETSEETTGVRDEEVGPPTRVMPEHMVRTLVGTPSPASSTSMTAPSVPGPAASQSMTSPTSVVPAATRMAALAGHAAGSAPRTRAPDPRAAEDERETRRREAMRRGTPDAFEREGTDGDFYAVDTVTKQRAEIGALAARGAAPAVPTAQPATPRSTAAARPSPPMRGGLPGSVRPTEDGMPMSAALAARAAESARMARPTGRNTLAGSLRAAAEGETRSEEETRVADPLADPARAALATRADTDGPSPEDETRVADGPLADAQRAALASSRAGTDVNGPEDETRVNPGPRAELARASARPERGSLAGSLRAAAEGGRAEPPRTALVGAGRAGADAAPRPVAGARPNGSGPTQAVPPPSHGSRPGGLPRPDSGTPLPEVKSPPPDILTPMPELAEMLSLTEVPSRPAMAAPVAPPPRPPAASIAGSAARFAASAARDSRPTAPLPQGPPSGRDSRPPSPLPQGPPSGRDSRPPSPLPQGPPSGRDSRPPAPLPEGPPARTLFGAPPAPGQLASGQRGSGPSAPHAAPDRFAPGPSATPAAPGGFAAGHAAPPPDRFAAGHAGPPPDRFAAGPSAPPPERFAAGPSGPPPDRFAAAPPPDRFAAGHAGPPPDRFAAGPSAPPPLGALSPPAPWQPIAPDPRFALDPASLPEPRVGPGPSMPPPLDGPSMARPGRPSGPPPLDEGPVGPSRGFPARAEAMPPPSFTLPEKPGGGLRVVLFGLLLAALAGGGYFGYLALQGDGATKASAAAPGTAPASATAASGTASQTAPSGSGAPTASDTAASGTASPTAPSGSGAPTASGTAASQTAPSGSGAPTASGTAAGTASPTGAGTASPTAAGAAPTGAAAADPPGELVVESQPDRARIYLDGAVVGKTPLTLEGNTDRHKLAIIAPGYKPHTAEIDGRGRIAVTLEEVTPSNGPAGIKVRCKQKNRYYVTLDGEPTGQLCPTERLGVELGDHVVEIYDPVTDSRRTYKVVVDQTRFSHRIRVD